MSLSARHNPRRLSPINDDLESEYGAEVKDIPLYRNYEPPLSKETKRAGKPSFDLHHEAPHTHELVALVTDPPPSSVFPLRSRYVEVSKSKMIQYSQAEAVEAGQI